MKYRLLIPSILTMMALAGCQQATAPGPEASADDQGGKLLVDEVMPDGSSERVMEIDLDNKKPVNISMTGKTNDLVLDQDGFSPSEITVKPGTNLVIEVRGEDKRWPMADPETEGCEGLDAGKELGPGETYEYLLESEQKCVIQDKMKPESKATITVEAE